MQVYQNFTVGQWVKSYAKGIHRIEKFIEVEYEEYHTFITSDWESGVITADKIGTLQDPFVVLKRLLNSKLKKQTGIDYAAASFLKELSKEEQKNVDDQLSANPKYLTDLDKYKIPAFENRYGLSMSLSDDTKFLIKDLTGFIKDNGKTFTEIFDWLEAHNYKQYLYKNTSPSDRSAYYFQFVNWSYAVKDNKFLFTDLLAFTPELAKINLD